ncbi:MAG: hypothetical protein ACKO3T_05875 [Planctomycetaceae bacterium]
MRGTTAAGCCEEGEHEQKHDYDYDYDYDYEHEHEHEHEARSTKYEGSGPGPDLLGPFEQTLLPGILKEFAAWTTTTTTFPQLRPVFACLIVLVLNEMVLVLVIEKKSPRSGRFDYDYEHEHEHEARGGEQGESA